MPAKTVAVLMRPVVIALSNVLPPHTLGTVATAALPHAKTPAKTDHVKVAAGKTVVVTTATLPALPHAAQLVTSSPVAPNSLVLATSNPTPQAKALQANAAARVC
jgi:ribosomal protein L10